VTTLFLLVCAVSVVFFLIFLLHDAVTIRKFRRRRAGMISPCVRKISTPQGDSAPVVDSACGRRFFAHLEEQMAHFLSAHRGKAALLLVLIFFAGPPARAQHGAEPGATPVAAGSTPDASDEQIPAAVAKQLAAMQKRIDELEQQLKLRSAAPASDQDEIGGGPAHAILDGAPQPAAGTAGPLEGNLQQEADPNKKPEPFSFADFTWLNGTNRVKDIPFDTKFFTPEIRADVTYDYSFNHPADDTIGGSAEVFRHNEFQLEMLGVGGTFHYDNVQARVMTQVGMYSQTQPRNDASPARGQWNLADAYRYLSEAWLGYHVNKLDGINLQAGIFLSYIGLFSWYNFDNWAYQPSYVSSNTPFYFNGMRVQIFPTEKLKLESWLINGWQSYGRYNHRPGLGFQVLYQPNGKTSFVSNGYGVGEDTLGVPGRIRYHSDSSFQYKYYENPNRMLDRMAFSVTGDIGCEHGGGVSCAGDSRKGPKQDFLGFMLYNRMWFHKDLYGLTLGGGAIDNPGRYLVLLPPINGATAASGTPYFTQNPGDPFKAWDASGTFDYMPSQYITFRFEYDHRHANVPYFSGPGGITPPGGNTGAPGSLVPGFTPDLVRNQNTLDLAIMVMF
jgi:hypothetical protein